MKDPVKYLTAWKVSVFWVFLFHIQSECGEYGPEKLQIRTTFTQYLGQVFFVYIVIMAKKTNSKQIFLFYVRKIASLKFLCSAKKNFYSIFHNWLKVANLLHRLNNRIQWNKLCKVSDNPANIYLLKVSNRNPRKRREICSKLTMMMSF